MLMRTDPFRELDRLTQQLFGTPAPGRRPTAMPMDAYREGDEFVVAFDLPGVDPDAIDLDVERNMLTVKAERRPSGRRRRGDAGGRAAAGVFSRQLFLGDTLDTEHIEASYDAGVLTLRIPVAEQAKPRKIAIAGEADSRSRSTPEDRARPEPQSVKEVVARDREPSPTAGAPPVALPAGHPDIRGSDYRRYGPAQPPCSRVMYRCAPRAKSNHSASGMGTPCEARNSKIPACSAHPPARRPRLCFPSHPSIDCPRSWRADPCSRVSPEASARPSDPPCLFSRCRL